MAMTGRELQVLLRLLEARDGERAHLGERSELLLRQPQAAPGPDRFFDKRRPIDLKLPFHRLSMREEVVV
jgi:hypothetical protein